jgi:hypothetical protein
VPKDSSGNPLVTQAVFVDSTGNIQSYTAQMCAIQLPNDHCLNYPANDNPLFVDQDQAAQNDSSGSTCQLRTTIWSWYCGNLRPVPTDAQGNPIMVGGKFYDRSGTSTPLTPSSCVITEPGNSCPNAPAYSKAPFIEYELQSSQNMAKCTERTTAWSQTCYGGRPLSLNASGQFTGTVTSVFTDGTVIGSPALAETLTPTMCVIQLANPGPLCPAHGGVPPFISASSYYLDYSNDSIDDATICAKRSCDWQNLCCCNNTSAACPPSSQANGWYIPGAGPICGVNSQCGSSSTGGTGGTGGGTAGTGGTGGGTGGGTAGTGGTGGGTAGTGGTGGGTAGTGGGTGNNNSNNQLYGTGGFGPPGNFSSQFVPWTKTP